MKSSSNDFPNPGYGKGPNSKKRVEVKPRGWQVSKGAQNKKKATGSEPDPGADSKKP